jgi:hypothetical protein
MRFNAVRMFFAPADSTGYDGGGEETSANNEGAAEPQTGTDAEDEPDGADETEPDAEGEGPDEQDEGAETVDQQSPETNAAFAAMRRRAEAAEREVKRLNDYATQYKGLENPVTHQPIQSASDYFAALSAQEQIKTQQALQNAGLDPTLIDKAVANNPMVREAQATIQRENQLRAQQMVDEDFERIIAMDPTVNSPEEVENAEGFNESVQYVQEHPGMRLSDAYKIVNFDRLSSAKTAAARQKAINDARSKQHLGTAAGVAAKDREVDIPQSELGRWRDMFPDASAKELKAKYNRMLKTQS